MVKLEGTLIIDGIDQTKRIGDSFSVAMKEISTGKLKPNIEVRRALTNNLKKLSDFLAGEGPGAIQGFFGDPKGSSLARYSSPKAAPDVEADLDQIEKALGRDVTSRLAIDRDVTDADKRTIELKQTASRGDTITFSGISVLGFGADTSGLEKIRRKQDKFTLKGDKASQEIIYDWLYSKAGEQFRKALFRAAGQKMQNLLVFVYVDEKGSLRQSPKVKIIPGFIKFFNEAVSSKEKAKKLLTVEVRDGSFTLRTTPAFDKFLADKFEDVTTQIQNAMVQDFSQNLVNYFTTGKANTEIKKALKGGGNYSLVQLAAELLFIATEFDPKFGGKELGIRIESPAQEFGPVTQKAKRKQKSKPQSRIQQAASETQMTQLVRRLMKAKMPKGQPGGPPPPVANILTYRTGQFVDSVNITRVDERASAVSYTYGRIYAQAHEPTSRNPRTLIEASIREAARRAINKDFRVTRFNRSMS